jgi:CRP-like cAMP-binding protein
MNCRTAFTLAATLAVVAPNAGAVGRLADVTIVDRTTGATLEPHYYRGEYWVAGAPGDRYSISIRSRQTGRLLAVTSVDGVNVVTGETASWQQTGYVFGPYQSYGILGWRKSDSQVADFEFTASPQSYAERTGRPANVGVIGVALFRERIAEPAVAQNLGRLESAAEAAAAAPAAKAAAAGRSVPADAGLASRVAPAPAPMEPKLGTGHGEREASRVVHTDFERLAAEPDEVIRIRYDSLANLVALGMIRPRAPLGGHPDPFPDAAPRYAPDPPGGNVAGLR